MQNESNQFHGILIVRKNNTCCDLKLVNVTLSGLSEDDLIINHLYLFYSFTVLVWSVQKCKVQNCPFSKTVLHFRPLQFWYGPSLKHVNFRFREICFRSFKLLCRTFCDPTLQITDSSHKPKFFQIRQSCEKQKCTRFYVFDLAIQSNYK